MRPHEDAQISRILTLDHKRLQEVEALTPMNLFASELRLSVLYREGPRHPVLLLHGNSSCNLIWAYQIEALTRNGFPLLAPDLPGHGLSDNATDVSTYSFPGYALAVQRLLDKLRWDSVDVIGWSLGGHIALELMATDDRVRSTMIVGTPPARPCPESLVDAFYATPTMHLAGKGSFSKSEAQHYGVAMVGSEELLTPSLLAATERADGRARFSMFQSALQGVGVDQRQLVESSERPLCIVHGENEPFVRLHYLQSISYRCLWRQRIHIMRGAGHAPHWESPEMFNSTMLAFLQDVERGHGRRPHSLLLSKTYDFVA